MNSSGYRMQVDHVESRIMKIEALSSLSEVIVELWSNNLVAHRPYQSNR
jgi:hypothetical protein